MNAENMTNYSIEELMEEANKTVVLCRNHHSEVEAGLHPQKQSEWLKEISGQVA